MTGDQMAVSHHCTVDLDPVFFAHVQTPSQQGLRPQGDIFLASFRCTTYINEDVMVFHVFSFNN